ncbi:MAG: class II aldolase/adducin family protein [Sedimenticolaceae bacterium]
MTETEGVIQYRLDYQPGTLPPDAALSGLFHWFRRCRERELIGRSPDRYAGAAYGNISIRMRRGFVISGTQTGGRADLTPDDLAWVLDFDIAKNQLTATGPSRPSSEAMTHGQIYRGLAAINAVIHIHSPRIWQQTQVLRLPMTAPFARYGTPQMAQEVERLLMVDPGATQGVFVMGGHEDGVVGYASGMDTAGELLLALQARAEQLLDAGWD